MCHMKDTFLSILEFHTHNSNKKTLFLLCSFNEVKPISKMKVEYKNGRVKGE